MTDDKLIGVLVLDFALTIASVSVVSFSILVREYSIVLKLLPWWHYQQISTINSSF